LVLLQPGTAPSPARFLGLTLELMTQVILELGVFFFFQSLIACKL
jgi:hypothetical protein